MVQRKGIVLAGGSGTRLYPLTLGLSKQLLPVYDKPMVYYSVTTLMLSGIRDILVITTPHDQALYHRVLGDGSQWGVNINYATQEYPGGIAQAFLISEKFLQAAPSALVLGDNIFYGHGLTETLNSADSQDLGATIFGYGVNDPTRYGVIEFDNENKVINVHEKPKVAPSNFAITGLYFVDCTASERAKQLVPSERNELEITSLLSTYLHDDQLSVQLLGRGYAWFDAGTHASLLEAGNYIRALSGTQGQLLGSPDEVAYRFGWISPEQLYKRIELFSKTDYGLLLSKILD